jgi:hypothetical protein
VYSTLSTLLWCTWYCLYNTHLVVHIGNRNVLKQTVKRSSTGERLGSILGTHTLRKTGYLFAIWGVLKYTSLYEELSTTNIKPKDLPLPCLSLANIMGSARHKCLQNAESYQVGLCILSDALRGLSMVVAVVVIIIFFKNSK